MLCGMRDSRYEIGQVVKVFETDRRLPCEGTITRVGGDVLDVTVGSFQTVYTFRAADQRRVGENAHLCHFRTMDQMAEEERYGRAVKTLSAYGLVQEIGAGIPVETLEKIGAVLAEDPAL